MTSESIDHDQLFKQLLETFFWEFIELFLPETLDYLLDFGQAKILSHLHA